MPADPVLRSRHIQRLPVPYWLKIRLQQLRNVQAEHREWRQACRRISAWQKAQTTSRPTIVLVGPSRVGKTCLAQVVAAKGPYLHVSLEGTFRRNLLACRDLERSRSATQMTEASQQAVKMIGRLCRRFPRNMIIETGYIFNGLMLDLQEEKACENSLRSSLEELHNGVRQSGCELYLALQMDCDLDGRLSALRTYRQSGSCWTSDVYDDRAIGDFAGRSLRLERLLRRIWTGSTSRLLEIDPSGFQRSIDRIAEALVKRAT